MKIGDRIKKIFGKKSKLICNDCNSQNGTVKLYTITYAGGTIETSKSLCNNCYKKYKKNSVYRSFNE